MCTAISFKAEDHYFGRNLDLYYNYNEKITITPRNFPFEFRKIGKITSHFAFIGVATIEKGYPLYYEATNEKGLSAAGLNFPQNACYLSYKDDKINLAPFELIPWLMCNFSKVDEAVHRLKNTNLIKINFSEKLPLSPLHWLISDSEKSVVLEPTLNGLQIYSNPVGVLTNNPDFPTQMLLLQNYSGISNENPRKTFSNSFSAKPYSLGMGAMGLPGDFSSPSRFVKAVFVKENSPCFEDEASAVGQFFHILSSVEQIKGSVKVDDGRYEYTVYSGCCNTNKGIYYYTTYENRSITAINMQKENLSGENLISFPLFKDKKIEFQN